jgi:hypothetical protein
VQPIPTSTIFLSDAAEDAKQFCHLPISTWSASVRHSQNNRITAAVAIFLLASSQMWSQIASGAHPPTRMQSIGDVIKSADHFIPGLTGSCLRHWTLLTAGCAILRTVFLIYTTKILSSSRPNQARSLNLGRTRTWTGAKLDLSPLGLRTTCARRFGIKIPLP